MSLEGLRAALHENGFRLTAARQAILCALVNSGGHITADQLVELVHQEAPGVGRMTVYRTLELLQNLGLVHAVYQGTGAAHYVLLDQGHHHHLVCSECDRIFEFDDCVVQDLGQTIARRFDFQIESHLLEFRGLCADCRATGSEP